MAADRGLPRARKRFGQHFLEPVWVNKLIRSIAPRTDDRFVEIGSGRGALTTPLAAASSRVAAFEIDRDLAAHVRETGAANITVVEGDFLESSAATVISVLGHGSGPVRVAGNLPYNVASPIIFHLLDLFAAGVPLADATLMLQLEVADRLLAEPGTREYGVLSVLVRHRATVQRLLALPPGAFRPPPAVESAVVRLQFHPPEPPARDETVFRDVTRAIFTRRRKTLANALLAYPRAAQAGPQAVLDQCGINGRRRPETLTIAELVSVSDAVTPA